MTNLHAENVAVEVDGLAAVAHLEHPVQGAAAQLQRHLLLMYVLVTWRRNKRCMWCL